MKPRLCEILNVEVDEKFNIKCNETISDFNYWVNIEGRLVTDSPFNKSPYDKLNYYDEIVVYLINGRYQILKGSDYDN